MPYRRNYRKPVNRSKYQKRWYVNASVPKSMPFIGGSSFRAGSGALNKRSLNTVIKRAITDNTALKQKVINVTDSANFQHDSLYTFNPLGNIPIGTGENARLATDIHIKSIKLNFLFNNRTDIAAPLLDSAVTVRMMWVRLEADYRASFDTFGSGVGTGDIFVDGQNSPMLSQLEKDKCTILSDTKFEIPATQLSGRIASKYITYDCPLKDFTFKYQSTTSGYSSVNKNVYLVCAAYLIGATTGVTPLCNYQFTSVVNFTDTR